MSGLGNKPLLWKKRYRIEHLLPPNDRGSAYWQLYRHNIQNADWCPQAKSKEN